MRQDRVDVYYTAPWLGSSEHCADLRTVGDDYYDFSRVNYLSQIGAEQTTDMRNLLFDKPAIRSCKPSNRDILIPYLDVTPFCQQSLDQLHRRALAQIVCPRLEAETNDANSLTSRRQHGIHRPIQMCLVAPENGSQKRQVQIHLL